MNSSMLRVAVAELPVEPRELVVLAVGVVVPGCVLRSSSPASSIGVPCESSSVARKFRVWRSRSAFTSGSSVSPSTPQFHERLSSRPVAVALEVRLVVLAVVRDEVAQREAVVAGDEVDRRGRVAAVVLVEVARAREPARELGRPPCGRARSRASCRGTSRSTPTRGSGSCRPGSRRGRRPTARRSASPARAPGPGG